MQQMPSMLTISRQLESACDRSVKKVQHLQRTLVVDAQKREQLSRITLD